MCVFGELSVIIRGVTYYNGHMNNRQNGAKSESSFAVMAQYDITRHRDVETIKVSIISLTI